jgi:hypothetical protein
MEKFDKTPSELDSQLTRVEPFVWGKIGPENLRKEILSTDINELKNKYPKDYRAYFSFLKTESKLLHFPDMEIEGNNEKPKMSLLKAGARGYAFKLEFPNESHVIKPLESKAEKDIAGKASSLEIGPKQFKTNVGYLHEEFIDGTPLLHLEKETCTPEFMENIGQKFAQALNKLHENNILVNDQIISDDFGKSHMIIDSKGEVRFIDFGASVDMSDFPNISDEEVMSLMRTDPFMAFRIHGMSEASEEEKKSEIKGYRDNILSQLKTKEDLIQMKDIQLLNEGLMFLQSRLPNVGSFIQGVKSEI